MLCRCFVYAFSIYEQTHTKQHPNASILKSIEQPTDEFEIKAKE